MFSEIQIRRLSDFEDLQVVDVSVTGIGGEVKASFILKGKFGFPQDRTDLTDVTYVDRILHSVAQMVRNVLVYQNSSHLYQCLLGLASIAKGPAVITVG